MGPISIGLGLFSNPTAIRDLPGVVIRSLPSRFATYPSSINRALCSAGIIAGGSSTAHVLPTTRREANSSGVRGSDSHAIIRLCLLTCIGTWSNLLRWANKPDLIASWPNARNSCFELERGKLMQKEAGPFFEYLKVVLAPLNRYLVDELHRRPLSPARVARFALADRRPTRRRLLHSRR